MTTPRPRVLHVVTHFALGGAEQVALTLLHGLRDYHPAAVFAVREPRPDAVGAAMRLELDSAQAPWFVGTRVPIRLGGLFPAALALARAVRAFQPDLLHLHTEIPEACGATLRALRLTGASCPLVRTIHNSVFWRYHPRIGRWCDRRLASARIACVSQAARSEFQQYRAESGAPRTPEPPVVIYNGVNIPLRSPRGKPLRPDRRRVLLAGRFEPQKGTDLLPAILTQTRLPAGIAGELVAVGQGTHDDLLRGLAARPPAGWSFTVRPPVPRLADILPEFDVLIMPSRFEGLGLTAIEATLLGLPVVATAAPGLSETLPESHPWWARPNDAAAFAATLQAALAEPDRWEPAVRAAQIFAQERFAPAQMIEGYRRIYGECHAGCR